MRIAGVFLRDFEPMADQMIEFPEKDQAGLAEVHFFVGQNGTGKTRLLSLLAAACGNPHELQYRTAKTTSAVVVDTRNNGEPSFRFGVPNLGFRYESNFSRLCDNYSGIDLNLSNLVGSSLMYMTQPEKVVAMAYRSIPSLEEKQVTPMGEPKWGDRASFLTFSHHANESTQIYQALANLKIRMGIVSNDRNDRTVRMILAFDDAIERITGWKLTLTVGYVGKDFRLKAAWGGKEMQLQQLPDGLRAVAGWLASCVTKLDMLHPDIENPLEQPLILLLDEPDAHLHPAWQRKLIPAVQHLLPNAQIFIATHSPFVVSSVNHGWIHVFEADEKGIVNIKKAQPCGLGDSYIDVVEDILGVREMFDPETEDMLRVFRSKRDAFKKQPNDESLLAEVDELAKKIGGRGETLHFMMGRELAQLETFRKRIAV